MHLKLLSSILCYKPLELYLIQLSSQIMNIYHLQKFKLCVLQLFKARHLVQANEHFMQNMSKPCELMPALDPYIFVKLRKKAK